MTVADDFDRLDDPHDHRGGLLGRIFGVAFDPHTYGAILYMLLALPLGIGYFTFVTVGLSLSVGLMILIIGIVVALIFMALTRGLSTVEGFITQVLLGAQISHRESDSFDGDSAFDGEEGDDEAGVAKSGLWMRIKRMFTDARTWTSMIYMALMLPLGVGYFTIAVTGFVVALSFIFAPIASVFTDHVHVMDISGDESEFVMGLSEMANSPVGLVIMALAGFVLLITMLHVSRGIGWFQARLAEKMLVKRS